MLLRGLLGVAGALALAIALERAAAWSGWRADLTFEQSFELAPATRKALAELPGELTATLYHDRFDPRARNTRLLLASLAEAGPVTVRERLLADAPEEADRYGIAARTRWCSRSARASRPSSDRSKSTLYEALYRLRSRSNGVIGVLRGEGEGDVSSEAELGFSGLAAALATEGYAGAQPRHAPRSPRSPPTSTSSCCWARGARCCRSRSPRSSATSSGAVAWWRCSSRARRAASSRCWRAGASRPRMG